MASGRIRNLDDFDLDNITYVVPDAVLHELRGLSADAVKEYDVGRALAMAAGMKRIILGGRYADAAILDHIGQHGGIVATTDMKLKRQVKAAGGSVISLHDARMVLESRRKSV